MIVILEGPDGSGKTTLARQLRDSLSLEYQHEGPTPTHTTPYRYYTSVLRKWQGCDVVFDRFALGERVYGPILRNGDRFTQDDWERFVRVSRQYGAIHVLCLPSRDDCFEVWSSGREEMFHDTAKFDATYKAFSEYREYQDFVYNWKTHTFQYVLNVLTYLKNYPHRRRI